MDESSVKTIVLADDHNVVRHSLRLFLETQKDFQVIGEAGNGIETINLVEQHNPDLLVIDLFMPVLNGLEVLRQLKKKRFNTKAVILSMHANEAYVIEAMKHGASAYVLKQSTASNLIQAIREVLGGQRYLSPPLSERAIEVYIQRAASEKLAETPAPLTVRESEVLSLVAKGLTSAEIAKRLNISPRTVEHHRASLMRKLKCRTPADLIRQALSIGVTTD